MEIREPFNVKETSEWDSAEILEASALLRSLGHKTIASLVEEAGVRFTDGETSDELNDDEQLIGLLFSDWDKQSLLKALTNRVDDKNEPRSV